MGHHHDDRGQDCDSGWWATGDTDGHHHHHLGHKCECGYWSTDYQPDSKGIMHHHHKRGGDCVEHNKWATGEDIVTAGTKTVVIDKRKYDIINKEL
ncbi:MAG: hypothetical protein ACXADY_02820 [Candidatus Hodarchaeales archaeon]